MQYIVTKTERNENHSALNDIAGVGSYGDTNLYHWKKGHSPNVAAILKRK